MDAQELSQKEIYVKNIEVIRISIDVLSKAINLLNRIEIPENTIMTKDIVQFQDDSADDLGELFDTAYSKIEMMAYAISERYRNKSTTYYFLKTHLGKVENMAPVNESVELQIFKFVEEYDYLLELKQKVEKYYTSLSKLIWYDRERDEYSDEFMKLFNHAYSSSDRTQVSQKSPKKAYERNPRFIFENLKEECDSIASLADRIELIEDRLNEFHHWQLKSDPTYYDRDLGPLYLITSEHYPHFEEQCELEKSHLMKKKERRGDTHPTINTANVSPYQWKATDTDLMELATALFQTNALQRKDGKSLTRKEITEYLIAIFGKEIKDPESTLKSAVARKREKAPFLDSLKKSFELYAEERDK